MKYVDIDKIIFNTDKINELVGETISYCQSLEKKILCEKTDTKSLGLLYECLYIIDLLYKIIGLIQIIDTSRNLTQVDIIVEKYKSLFFYHGSQSILLYNKMHGTAARGQASTVSCP